MLNLFDVGQWTLRHYNKVNLEIDSKDRDCDIRMSD